MEHRSVGGEKRRHLRGLPTVASSRRYGGSKTGLKGEPDYRWPFPL